MGSFKELISWQKGYKLSILVYRITSQLPHDEKFGLSSQMQRCAVSIPSNIAEGHQRNNTKEFMQFIGIAKGSAAELETQLLICHDVYDISVSDALELVEEIRRLLSATVRSLKTKVTH